VLFRSLREGVTANEAGALIATFTWRPVYAQLTEDYGLSYHDCERLIAAALQAALLR